jgi:hypothetical protein
MEDEVLIVEKTRFLKVSFALFPPKIIDFNGL